MSDLDERWRLAQTFVAVGLHEPSHVQESVRAALVVMQQPAVVRRMNGSPWVQVIANGNPLPDVSLSVRMKFRKATAPKRGTPLEGLGWRISVITPFDVLTVEVEDSVASLRFARWRNAHLLRRYYFHPERQPPLRLNEGRPENWEKDVNSPEFGITHDDLVDALRLPGWRTWTAQWDHVTRVQV